MDKANVAICEKSIIYGGIATLNSECVMSANTMKISYTDTIKSRSF